MIELVMTAEEFAAKSQELAEKHDIILPGREGTIEKSGVTASYLYADGLLVVKILEKPFFMSTESCEDELRKFLAD